MYASIWDNISVCKCGKECMQVFEDKISCLQVW